ncbi:MAG: FdtA/QdtA family cupin domain-containing protein [Akkermansiaceae bacterium]|nr:FdtA/QdtA family cupin domain-containing protein [Akkermansiaceae bacterium]MCF7730760.1 FdtA/QdtA family cupin domain-containing protein [Akkermansiaceae bacterium]
MNFDLTVPQLIPLPEIRDERGVKVLGFAEPGTNCPFPIRRMYYMYDFPVGLDRGNHAHRECHRQLIALAGRVEVELELGDQKWRFTLASPGVSLFVPAPCWIVYRALEPGTVLTALASEPFDEADYIRNYHEFKNHAHSSDR